MSGVIGTSGKKIVTREGYGDALVESGREDEKIVVLDAGSAAATKAGILERIFPKRRIDCGIAECNMMGIAVRLTVMDTISFANSFTIFTAGGAFEQVRNSIGYPRLNVKVSATHAEISMGEDETIHQCNEDTALMWTIPGMVVTCPSDNVEAKAIARTAAEHDGPVYLRFGRLAVPAINDREGYNFTISKGTIPREDKDMITAVTGLLVSSALEMVALLEKDGIDAEVINTHIIKSLGEESITAPARETGKAVTVGEYPVIRGLGSVVCDALCGNYPASVKKISMQDQFGESNPVIELIYRYGLGGEGIYIQVKKHLGR